MDHYQPFLKITSSNFYRYFVPSPTDNSRLSRNLPGRGNNVVFLFELCQPLFLLSKVNDLRMKAQRINLLASDVKLSFNDGSPAAFLRLTLESCFSGMTFPMGAIKHAHVSGDLFFSVDCRERGAFLPSFGLQPRAPRPSTYFYLISVLTIVL